MGYLDATLCLLLYDSPIMTCPYSLPVALSRKKRILLESFLPLQDKDESLSGEHVREGLTCIISVKVPNPEFEGQTKVRSISSLMIRCFGTSIVLSAT